MHPLRKQRLYIVLFIVVGASIAAGLVFWGLRDNMNFFYAPAPEVLDRAAREGAVAFDLPGAPVSHVGERCSFDALLDAFGLHWPALDRLADTVRGADTDRLAQAPAAAGLLAVSLGMSRLHADDDHAMLEAMMPVYDALYAECSERVAGRVETHRWTPA